jgi:alkylation response protein AidB-like acyl-CoA dehydrogenase
VLLRIAESSASLDYDFAPEAQRLRARLRELIREHLPTDFHGAFTHDPADFEMTKRFCKLLAAEELLTLAWPTEYGGRGGSVWEQTVVREEMWAHHEPRGAQYMGLNWVGPAIMQFGTDAQKSHHLPLIAKGEVVWCQGFSEPNAGSDLASLQTSARLLDGRWRINGQKVWTSYAPMAQYCMLAVRTSRTKPPRAGITIFMLPMDRGGVEVRPIASMLGPQHLNEVFLTDVEADEGEMLGEVNGGWSVIRYILTRERVGIARYARCDRLLNEVRVANRDRWDQLPQSLRARYVKSVVHNRVARLLTYRVVNAIAEGDVDDADAAAARLAITRGDQEVTDVLMEILGERCLDAHRVADAPLGGAVEDYWRYAQAATVASGALEVQQLLLARSVLGQDHAIVDA